MSNNSKQNSQPQRQPVSNDGEIVVLEDNAQRTVTKLPNGTIRTDMKMGKIKFVKKDGVEVQTGGGGLAIQ
jgi:hypothetical protein